ncbi:MAG: hypothetical protein Q8910_00205 [Bacteroidota bacterium]|nr:hypothetical protein [Bacteroidota bacterium]
MSKDYLSSIPFVDPSTVEVPVDFEYTWNEGHDWVYSFGQLEDGQWFWTYFGYEIFNDEKGERIIFYNKPSVNEMLKWASLSPEERTDSFMGIYLFEDPEDMLDDILENIEDEEDELNLFHEWAGMLLEWKIKRDA